MTLLDRSTRAPCVNPIDDIIPEARQRARSRRLKVGFFLSVLASVIAVLILGGVIAGGGPPRVHTNETRPGEVLPLAPGAQLGASSVVALQMFNLSAGVGISSTWSNESFSANRSYLTETASSGSRWRVLGQLPEPTDYPLMLFMSPSEGYVADGSSLLFTRDRGRSWSTVAVAGPTQSLTDSKGTIWAMSNSCANQAAQTGVCTTVLNVLRPGALTPISARPVPSIPSAAWKPYPAGGAPKLTATLLARISPSSGVAVEGSDGPNSLLMTIDSGRRWSQLSDPCGQLTVGSMVAFNAARWDIFCSQGGGMMQATNRLFATSDGGKDWSLLAYGNQDGSIGGTLGDGYLSNFGASADGRILWYTAEVGFMNVSTDGGRTWRYPTPNLTDGWDWGHFVVVGHSAWLAMADGGLVHTTNGVNWMPMTSGSR